MPATAALLDDMSVFAELGLCALALGAIAWVCVDQTVKWRSVGRLKKALAELADLEDELPGFGREKATERPGHRVRRGRLTLERLIRTRPAEAMPGGAKQGGPDDVNERRAEEDGVRDQAAKLSRLRADIGSSAASGLEYVLARDPKLRAKVGSVNEVMGFLQECDRIEREIGARSRRPRRRPAGRREDEPGPGRPGGQ